MEGHATRIARTQEGMELWRKHGLSIYPFVSHVVNEARQLWLEGKKKEALEVYIGIQLTALEEKVVQKFYDLSFNELMKELDKLMACEQINSESYN